LASTHLVAQEGLAAAGQAHHNDDEFVFLGWWWLGGVGVWGVGGGCGFTEGRLGFGLLSSPQTSRPHPHPHPPRPPHLHDAPAGAALPVDDRALVGGVLVPRRPRLPRLLRLHLVIDRQVQVLVGYLGVGFEFGSDLVWIYSGLVCFRMWIGLGLGLVLGWVGLGRVWFGLVMVGVDVIWGGVVWCEGWGGAWGRGGFKGGLAVPLGAAEGAGKGVAVCLGARRLRGWARSGVFSWHWHPKPLSTPACKPRRPRPGLLGPSKASRTNIPRPPTLCIGIQQAPLEGLRQRSGEGAPSAHKVQLNSMRTVSASRLHALHHQVQVIR
jgi:hypothetical protein